MDGLDREAWDPLVVLHDTAPLTDDLDARGIPYDLRPALNYPSPARAANVAPWLLRRLPGTMLFLKRHRIALVHVTESPAAELWAVAARACRIPVLWQLHSPDTRSLAALPRLAGHYACVSRYLLEDCLPDRLKPYASVVPNGFQAAPPPDRGAAGRMVRAACGVPEDAAVIGFCGRVSDRKRPDLFVAAAVGIAARARKPVAFVLVGDDRQGVAATLAAEARCAGIGDRVHFAGFRPEGRRWIAGFDILLVPAEGESFGRVLVEAMQAGTPAVASDSGGHGEILRDGENGLLVPANDAQGLARAALLLLGNPAMAATLVEGGRATARAFEKAPVSRDIQSLYARITARPRRETG